MAQITGEVNFKELGIRFTVPPDWIGQESEGLFMMGSNTIPGIILMTRHEYSSIEAIREAANEGLEDEGVSPKLSGTLESFGNDGIGAEFSGTINGQQGKAYLLSLLNPYGSGITIMSATESDKYSETYKQLVLAVGKSIQFSKAEIPAVVQQWKQELKDKRLSYIFSSSSRTFGYTGRSQTEEIWLCGAGYFEFKSGSGKSFDTGGSSGYSAGKDMGPGNRDVVSDGSGGAVLQLRFEDGKVSNYAIQRVKNEKLYLNGYDYF